MTRRKAEDEKKRFYSPEDISEIIEETFAQFDFEHVHWLSDEDYAKAIGQLGIQLTGVFEPFNMYGQHVYIEPAIREIIKLCEDFGLRVRGIDKAISLEIVRRKALAISQNTIKEEK